MVRLQEQTSYDMRTAVVANVATVLLRADVITSNSDDAIVQLLSDKYDALREKILNEAVIAEVRNKTPILVIM